MDENAYNSICKLVKQHLKRKQVMNSLKHRLFNKLYNTPIKLISIANKLNTVELDTDDIEIKLLSNIENIITITCDYHLKVTCIDTHIAREVTATTFNDTSVVIEVINEIRRRTL